MMIVVYGDEQKERIHDNGTVLKNKKNIVAFSR